ncbi:MAG: hypothetical protein ACYTFT_00815 [Planctomycetota bacterium]
MSAALLLANAASTLAMVGLIWFVQVVHYPLMARVGVDGFHAYESAHVESTTRVVVPLMLIELATAVLLCLVGGAVPFPQAALGLVLLVGIWLSTFALQVPLHTRLSQRFDAEAHRRLVRTNWIRTALWTARATLALGWVGAALNTA